MIKIKNFLKDKTIITDLSVNKIDEDMIVHTVYFDRDKFNDKGAVVKYLKTSGFRHYVIGQLEDTEEKHRRFYSHFIKRSQRNPETSLRVELEDGVTAYANLINACELNKNENQLVDLFDCVDLKEERDLPTIIELAKTVKGNHPWYGEVRIEKDQIKEMKKNFNDKVHGVDIAINLDHRRENAVGWVTSVESIRNDNRLIGEIKWNNKGTEILENGEYRYISPEIAYDYKHHLTSKEHGTVLTGAALTNYPFLQMKPVVKMNDKGNKEVKNKKRSLEMPEETKENQTRDTELELKLKDFEHRNKELEKEATRLQSLIDKSIAEATHQKLFSEGKITAAQLDALNEGKNPLDVISMNAPIKTAQAGMSQSKEGEVELTPEQKEAMRRLGLKDEKYYKMFMKK